MVADSNHLMRREPALHEVDFDYTGFEWIDCHNWQNSVLVLHPQGEKPGRFPRSSPATSRPCRARAICWACRNTAGTKRFSTAIRHYYGGSNLGNGPGIMATDHMAHGRPYSIEITLPPLAVVVLKPRR